MNRSGYYQLERRVAGRGSHPPGKRAFPRHTTIIRLSAVLAVVALTKGCGDGDSPTAPSPVPDPPRPTTVTVSPSTHELTALGETVQLTAAVRDQNARVMAGATVTWTSSANSVATVDASGLVTAAGNGTATITANSGEASGSAAVTVMQSVASSAAWASRFRLPDRCANCSIFHRPEQGWRHSR